MWIVSAEDLALSKLLWARESESELQRRDVRQIIAAQPGLEWSYIERWAALLGVADLLRQTRT